MDKLKFDLDKVKEKYGDYNQPCNAEDMAAVFGTTKNTLYSWKKGIGLDKIVVIAKIMRMTRLSFEELFNLETDEQIRNKQKMN